MFNRANNNLLTHFAKTGKAQQIATFPWLSTDFTSFASPLGENLGSTWFDDFGNVFMLKVARGGNLAFGALLTWNLPATDTATAASTTRVVTLTTGGLTAGAEVNNWAFCTSIGSGATGTDKTQALKLIKASGTNTLTVSLLDTKYGNSVADPDAYATAPANTNPIVIIRPFEAITFPTAGATSTMPCGIAAQAITQNTYGFTQVGGLALVQSKGDVTALVAGASCAPDGVTAGYVKGAAAPVANSPGICCAAITTATTLSPIWLTITSY